MHNREHFYINQQSIIMTLNFYYTFTEFILFYVKSKISKLPEIQSRLSPKLTFNYCLVSRERIKFSSWFDLFNVVCLRNACLKEPLTQGTISIWILNILNLFWHTSQYFNCKFNIQFNAVQQDEFFKVWAIWWMGSLWAIQCFI